MYKPAPRADTNNLEFVELFNANPFFEDLSGFRLSGDVDFTFPPGTLIAPRTYVVLAKSRQAFAQAYGTGIPVLGEFAGAPPEESTGGGTSDARFIAPLGAQCIEIGPVNAKLVVSESPITVEPDRLGTFNAVVTVPQSVFEDGQAPIRYLVRSDRGFRKEVGFVLLGPYDREEAR